MHQRAYRSRIEVFLRECKATLGIDRLHLQFKKEQLLASSAAAALQLPVVWTEHGRLPAAFARTPVALWAYRRASRSAQCILCVSDAVRNHLATCGVRHERLLRCYNGIDLPDAGSSSEPARIRRSLGLPDDALVIGSTSRLTRIKGPRYLIEALPAVFAQFPAARALVVGDGPEREALQERTRQLRCESRVLFTGHRSDARTLLAAMNVHVTPSLSDGLSYAVLEAMAAGVPVLATGVGGNPEAVGDAGLVVEPADATALTEALTALLADPARMAWLGERGRQRVATQFSTTRMIDTTESVFLAAGAQKTPRAAAAEAA